MISLVSWRTWGMSSRTRRGVKPWLMRRRVRMCSSPSSVMIDMSPAMIGRTPNRLQYSLRRRGEMWKTSSWRARHVQVVRLVVVEVVEVPQGHGRCPTGRRRCGGRRSRPGPDRPVRCRRNPLRCAVPWGDGNADRTFVQELTERSFKVGGTVAGLFHRRQRGATSTRGTHGAQRRRPARPGPLRHRRAPPHVRGPARRAAGPLVRRTRRQPASGPSPSTPTCRW